MGRRALADGVRQLTARRGVREAVPCRLTPYAVWVARFRYLADPDGQSATRRSEGPCRAAGRTTGRRWRPTRRAVLARGLVSEPSRFPSLPAGRARRLCRSRSARPRRSSSTPRMPSVRRAAQPQRSVPAVARRVRGTVSRRTRGRSSLVSSSASTQLSLSEVLQAELDAQTPRQDVLEVRRYLKATDLAPGESPPSRSRRRRTARGSPAPRTATRGGSVERRPAGADLRHADAHRPRAQGGRAGNLGVSAG